MSKKIHRNDNVNLARAILDQNKQAERDLKVQASIERIAPELGKLAKQLSPRRAAVIKDALSTLEAEHSEIEERWS